MTETVMTGITTLTGNALAIPVLLLFVAVMYALTGVDVANISISIITLLLLPILQHAQNRDTAALHAKMDEMIRASDARNDFIGLDRKPEAEIERLRE